MSSLNIGVTPDPDVRTIVSSPLIAELHVDIVEQGFLDGRSVLEKGDPESYTSVQRTDAVIWEIHESNRGSDVVRVRTNDTRVIIMELVSSALAFRRRVLNFDAPRGVALESDGSSTTLRWGVDSWATYPDLRYVVGPLSIAHLVVASEDDILRSMRSVDGSPLFRAGITLDEAARDAGLDIRDLDLAHWQKWLESRRG